MKRPVLGWLIALGAFALVSPERAQAQLGGLMADPFSFYYGYYLPHQAAQAAQPRAIDSINQVVAQRQLTAQTDRSELFDPISPYNEEDSEMFSPYNGSGRGGGRQAPGVGRTAVQFGYGSVGSTRVGNGPVLYYNRTARYFPTLRTGRGPNQNLAPAHNRHGGGMPSMPSMPSMGGPY